MRRLALAFLLTFWAALAHAAVGTPVQLGTGSGTTTFTITTGADAPIGSLIVVIVAVGTSNTAATSVVDSQLNCTTYTALDNTALASFPNAATFYCANTASDLAVSSTITITLPAAATGAATAIAVSGMSSTPADASNHYKNGSGLAATSTATGTLAQGPELVVGTLALSNTASNFASTNMTLAGSLSTSGGSVFAAYMITCSTASVAWAPTWTTSRNYRSDVVSFKAASSSVATACSSKINTYIVLMPGTTASKINTYIVLMPGTKVGGLLFQGVP